MHSNNPMFLLSLPGSVLVTHIAARLPVRDRWRLRCASQKVRRMILECVQQPWPDLVDLSGRDVVLLQRTKEHWLRCKASESIIPGVYHDAYRDIAGFAALVFAPAWCRMERNQAEFYDDLPFFRDFLIVLRERVLFGYVEHIERWFERCGVCVDNYGFFQCDSRALNPPRIRIGLWEDGRKRNSGGWIFQDEAAERFAIQHMRAVRIED
jgi:hypothetical protein